MGVVFSHEGFHAFHEIVMFVSQGEGNFRLVLEIQDVNRAFALKMEFVANAQKKTIGLFFLLSF